jgi:polyketide synthase PksN/surfactin family lipopeptide synthetase A
MQMNEVYKYIVENIADNKIEKQAAVHLLKLLKQKTSKSYEDVAVIGMALQFPEADNVEEFWHNLVNGMDAVGKFPKSRSGGVEAYLTRHLNSEITEVKYSYGAYLKAVDGFDYDFFHISPKEATYMDPSQRLFLQTAWHAIEDAGYNMKQLKGTKTGVYVGFSGNANYQNLIYDFEPANLANSTVGNIAAMLPSRLSYLFDFKGPSMVIDSACSSSVVAVHLAAKALKSGECDMAVAGGIRLNLLPIDNDNLKIGVEASDGKTKSFDNNAQGAGIGEGVAALFLKPLPKALKDRDNIYAVIKGSAINQDGNSMGLTAPNFAAQAKVMTQAWEDAAIHPESLSFIEAHGTATALGDPIEMEGICRAFKKYTDKKQFCAIGSVKTNIGHLYECSGMAGLIKSILALQYRMLPPSLHFNRPNSQIVFQNSPVYVNTRPRMWKSHRESPLRCGVSVLGISGTNGHIVLEEAPKRKEEVQSAKAKDQQVLTISARSKAVLQQKVKDFIQYLTNGNSEDLINICYTANTGREHFNYRMATIFCDKEDLIKNLIVFTNEIIENEAKGRIFYGEHKVISGNKQRQKQSNDITENEMQELSDNANQKIKDYSETSAVSLLTEISILYTQGAAIDWEALYQKRKPKRVSLPLYPFATSHCWVNMPKVDRVLAEAEMKDNHYTVTWREEEPIQNMTQRDGTVLILMDEMGLGQQLAARFREAGRKVVEARMGSVYQQAEQDKYLITGTEKDYFQLLSDLKERDISQIIHLFTFDERDEIVSLEELAEIQQRGVLSLFNLVKAADGICFHHDLDVVMIADYVEAVTGAEEKLKPQHAMLFGMGKVVKKEHAQLKCRCIDIDQYTGIEKIEAELNFISETYTVAYRSGVRYIEEFSPAEMDNRSDVTYEIKNQGVYIITGGMGGIGLEVAKYIASCNQTNIALIGRSKMPERERWEKILNSNYQDKQTRQIRTIMELEANGSTVSCLSADVANRDEMEIVIGQLRERFGKINGVIHGAGLADDGPLVQKSKGAFQKILQPKVVGTFILDQLTSTDKIDFFILFSSVATIFSTSGQSDYAAANAYLDAYAAYRNRKGKLTRTINWTTWKEVGMAAESGFTADTIFKTLPTQQAIDGLKVTLKKAVNRVLIGHLNYEGGGINLLERAMIQLSSELTRRIKTFKEQSSHKVRSQKPGNTQVNEIVTLVGRENESYSEIERKLAQIWGENLGFGEIDVYDGYYELGGDSIIGIKIVTKVSEMLQIPLSVVDLLKYQTIESLAQYLEEILQREGCIGASYYPAIELAAEAEFYPASSAQKRMFMLHKLQEDSTNYNITRFVTIRGGFEIERFDRVIQDLIKRHEILRTSLALVDGEIVQRVHEEVRLDIDYQKIEAKQLDQTLKNYIQPFDLSKAPMFRVGVLEMGKDHYMMMVDMHHAMTDGVSMDIFIKEFADLYRGLTLPELRIQYKDFAVWQNKLRGSELLRKQEEYWLGIYGDEVAELKLPIDFERPEIKSVEGARVIKIADQELTAKVGRFAAKTETTVYMVLLSVYTIFLSKCTVAQDIVVGSPITGRPLPELEQLIGMFVNTLAIRVKVTPDHTLREFLKEVKEIALNAYQNQDFQFEELVSKIGLQRDLSNNPLFNTMFILQNVGMRSENLDEFEWSPYEIQSTTSMFDILLEGIESQGEIIFNLEYSTKLFKKETVEKMMQDFMGLLHDLDNNLDLRIGDIELESSKNIMAYYEENEEVIFNF